MSAAEELHVVALPDYLDLEERAGRRHEWVQGRVYVMAGGSERHDLMSGLLYELAAPRARAQGCRAFIANRKLRTADAVYYPDVFVSCSSSAHVQYEDDASLVIEVLSPSTRDHDYREKAAAYLRLPSLQAYVLVDPEVVHVEVADRVERQVRWRVFGAGDVVVAGSLTVVVDDLYDVLEASAVT